MKILGSIGVNNRLLSSLLSLLLSCSINSNSLASFKTGTRKILEGVSDISYVITDMSLVCTVVSSLGLGISAVSKSEKPYSFFLTATKISGLIVGISATAGYLSQKVAKYLK